jgi:hypothetical protein
MDSPYLQDSPYSLSDSGRAFFSIEFVPESPHFIRDGFDGA